MHYDFDLVIVGAGTLGLAIGKKTSTIYKNILLLEKSKFISSETSSRNSEVIHAGIYYNKGSLKSNLCIEGKRQLYEYLKEKDIRFIKCGKWIVGNSLEEIKKLEDLKENASQCGLDDLYYLNLNVARSLEPQLKAKAVLVSPSTGIFDTHQYHQSLLYDFEKNGGTLVCQTKVSKISTNKNIFTIETVDASNNITSITSRNLILSAGLYSSDLLSNFIDYNQALTPDFSYAKGTYYSYSGNQPFSRLIYPIPDKDGLGIHYTLDISGYSKFGPDVEWVEAIDYKVGNENKDHFVRSIRKYFPAIDAEKLQPSYSGIRPKIIFKNQIFQDFCIQTHSTHGFAGCIVLLGIESPGLTSSLAIADEAIKYLIN